AIFSMTRHYEYNLLVGLNLLFSALSALKSLAVAKAMPAFFALIAPKIAAFPPYTNYIHNVY
ncbi:MAG: hypothetical protein AAGJ82_01270, partial [Bacteroidota bacterium]